MKQEIASILARSPLLREIDISRTGDGWVIYLRGEGGAAIVPGEERIETARGGVRTWASLDTAQAWIATLLGDDRDPGIVVTLNW